MKNRLSKTLISGLALVLFIALPAAAERASRGTEPHERALVRVLKVVKRVLGGVSTTADLPTVPKP